MFRCISFGQFIALFIVITIISMTLGWAKLGSTVSLALLLWWLAGLVFPCKPLDYPSAYAVPTTSVPAVPLTTPQ